MTSTPITFDTGKRMLPTFVRERMRAVGKRPTLAQLLTDTKVPARQLAWNFKGDSTRILTLKTVKRIADVLRVSIDELIDRLELVGTEERSPQLELVVSNESVAECGQRMFGALTCQLRLVLEENYDGRS